MYRFVYAQGLGMPSQDQGAPGGRRTAVNRLRMWRHETSWYLKTCSFFGWAAQLEDKPLFEAAH